MINSIVPMVVPPWSPMRAKVTHEQSSCHCIGTWDLNDLANSWQSGSNTLQVFLFSF